jgi:hypothetical protein
MAINFYGEFSHALVEQNCFEEFLFEGLAFDYCIIIIGYIVTRLLKFTIELNLHFALVFTESSQLSLHFYTPLSH